MPENSAGTRAWRAPTDPTVVAASSVGAGVARGTHYRPHPSQPGDIDLDDALAVERELRWIEARIAEEEAAARRLAERRDAQRRARALSS